MPLTIQGNTRIKINRKQLHMRISFQDLILNMHSSLYIQWSKYQLPIQIKSKPIRIIKAHEKGWSFILIRCTWYTDYIHYSNWILYCRLEKETCFLVSYVELELVAQEDDLDVDLVNQL